MVVNRVTVVVPEKQQSMESMKFQVKQAPSWDLMDSSVVLVK